MVITLMTSTIAISVGLINFNRYLMQPGRFPYPAALTMTHMIFCSVLSGVLRLACPGLFPTVVSGNLKLDARFYLKGVFPIAVFFATTLILSNMVYAHLSIAFIQMLKETGVVTTYILSLMTGLEIFSIRHLQVIVCLLVGAALATAGELHFSWIGFAIQMSSQISDCSRIVLQSIMLDGHKMDAMSYVYLVSPVCFATLAIVLGVMRLLPAESVPTSLAIPQATLIHEWAWIVLANCALAFCLNLSSTLLIQKSGPMIYIFTGVLKDIVAVLSGVFIIQDVVTMLQIVAFSLQIVGIFTWGLLKDDPSKFENGILPGLFHHAQRLLTSSRQADKNCAESRLAKAA